MKKLILIFGIFAIVCVIVTSFSDSAVQSLTKVEDNKTQTENTDYVYEIKSENGKIVVFKNNERYLRTSTAVNTLPKIDQQKLLYGIKVQTKDEMNKVLEQFCS